VDPEVRTGNEVLDSAGAGFLGITDEPSFTAEPVKNYLLGLVEHPIAAAHLPYNGSRRYTGETIAIEDKGSIARNYIDYRQPDLTLALIELRPVGRHRTHGDCQNHACDQAAEHS
jgi:hypothetical protein